MEFNFDAVIFDLNGTILSDEDEYGKAFNIVLKKFGIDSKNPYPHESGIGVAENWIKFKTRYTSKLKLSDQELAAMTQDVYLSIFDKVTLKDGIVEFIKNLRNANVKIALATSNNWSVVERVFEKFDLEKLFDIITTHEEISKSKPDPEIFILTARKLEVNPNKCVVFEDSIAGVEAAKKAGMKVVGIARDDSYADKLKGVDKIITNYLEFIE